MFFEKQHVATNCKAYKKKSGMVLKNQNNKIIKVHYLEENPSLKENKKKKMNKLPQNPRTKFLAKEALLSLTKSFSIMIHNHAKVLSYCKLKSCCFV